MKNMKRNHVAWLVGLTPLLVLAAWVVEWRDKGALLGRVLADGSIPETRVARTGTRELSALLEDEGPRPPRAAIPEGHIAPTSEKELAQLVAWLRSLDHDELLRLSNADFRFEDSELIEMLQQLRGPWVLTALGDLAIAEADPLLKAILVEGLVGGFASDRFEDGKALALLDTLLRQMHMARDDPFGVAAGMAGFAFYACRASAQDYAAFMSDLLAESDNGRLLQIGYLEMGVFGGGEQIIEQVLFSHASPDGRFGALEGLRNSGGRISPEKITALGLSALESETNERNRLLLYEMMISTGGEDGLTAVEQALRAGKTSEIDETVEMLALKMEPDRARALFQDLLQTSELDAEAKQALYNAMGLLKGDDGAEFLLGLARDEELDGGERLAGLRGLWNREIDEDLAADLRSVFDTAEDAALRTEAMRMLAYGEHEGDDLDLRAIAALDDDPSVRAEAVQLAAMQPAEDSRAWLEERLLEDDSYDVKAAALGALVYQAHYAGDGEAVLGYLARARQFTDDEAALAMIAEGERMVRDYDPRNLELGLAKEAEFWGSIAKLTDGPAARSFQRQARQLSQIVANLRASRDPRRPAR